MTLTQVMVFGSVGTNTALATGSSEHVTVYTVPAGQTMLLKEARLGSRGATGVAVGMYIKKTGGTNLAHGTALTPGGVIGNQLTDVIVLKGEVTTDDTSYTVTALNMVLGAGDAVMLRIKNTSGGNINATSYGINGSISGDLV